LYDNITVLSDDLKLLLQGKNASSCKLCYASIANNCTNILRAGVVGAKLLALSKKWARVDAKQQLTCKTMRLLDFPHHETFFENAIDIDFVLQITKNMAYTTLEAIQYDPHFDAKSAVRHKQLLVASFTGLRELSIDVQNMGDFFDHVAELVMKWKDEGMEWEDTLTKGPQDTNVTRCRTRWGRLETALDPSPTTVEHTLTSHFANLRSLELRSSMTLYNLQETHPESDGQGTLVLQGSWPNFPALQNVNYHGRQFADEFIRLFFRTCLPKSISLNGWQCHTAHPDFAHHFAPKRSEFQNTVTSFLWKNMEPCSRVVAIILSLLMTQRTSLKSLSLVRCRRTEMSDVPRGLEIFGLGSVNTAAFEDLEYLDIDARFLIQTQGPHGDESCTWLNLPHSIRTLSIDAITKSEIPYTKRYLQSLLQALQDGYFPQLKEVRCGFMGIKGSGVRVDPWKCLGNMAGKFLGARGAGRRGVWLKEWEYDYEEVEVEEPEDSVARRVAARRRAGAAI
jgi:hypothetical protein